MDKPVLLEQINALSIDDRIELVDAIWEGIAAENEPYELTPEFKAELERRLDAMEANPGANLTWEQIKARIPGLR